MISDKNISHLLRKSPSLTFCLLAVFLPLGSTIGVFFSWILLPILSIVMTLSFSSKFQMRGVVFFISSLTILLSNYFITVQYVDFNKKLEFNLLLAVIGCFYISVSFFSTRFSFQKLIDAIDTVLIINITLFIIQFLAHYIFGYRVDYSQMSGGIGTRNDYGEIFRASGIFNEPAEYSSAMIILVTIRYLVTGRLVKNQWLTLLTVALSLSFVGIFQAISFFSIVYLKEIRKRPIYLIPIILVLSVSIFSFYDFFMQRYEVFMTGTDGSNNTKVDTFRFFLEHENYLYGGAGLIGYDPETMPLFMQGLYDLTFFGASITIFGVFLGSILSFIMLLFIFKKYNKSEVMLILLCLVKVNVMIYASYWFFIISLIVIVRSKKRFVEGYVYEN